MIEKINEVIEVSYLASRSVCQIGSTAEVALTSDTSKVFTETLEEYKD